MPAIPKSIQKSIATRIKDAVEAVREPAKATAKVGKYTYKIAREFDLVEFYNEKNQVSHSVAFTNAEQQHLKDGGTIVIVHACGTEAHISVPNPFKH